MKKIKAFLLMFVLVYIVPVQGMRHASDIQLNVDDVKIVENIIDTVNTHVIRNPTLRLLLDSFNALVSEECRLSEERIVMILKNSALLISIDEIMSLGEIICMALNRSNTACNVHHLHELLKVFDLDEQKTVLELWERKNFLMDLYALREYKAVDRKEREECAEKIEMLQDNFDTIITMLGITNQYAAELRRLHLVSHQNEKKLYELFEDAFSGEKEGLSLEAYLQSILTKMGSKTVFY